jgi:hypothetical protein
MEGKEGTFGGAIARGDYWEGKLDKCDETILRRGKRGMVKIGLKCEMKKEENLELDIF